MRLNRLSELANNDNEIGNIARFGNEYLIEIKKWNGEIVKLKTENCRSITHNVEISDEIGDIVCDKGICKFMTADNADVILSVDADELKA